MDILNKILAQVDNAKRVAARNTKDAIENPADFLNMLTGRVKEQNAKFAAGENAVETVGLPGGLGFLGTMVPAYVLKGSNAGSQAAKKLASGQSPRDVFNETGVYVSPVDSRFKSVISDANARIKPEALDITDRRLTLGDVLDHPELFKAVPDASDTTVNLAAPLGTQGGSFDILNNIITVRKPISKTGDNSEALSTLLHEVQHKLQDTYNFDQGGSAKQFISNLDTIASDRARLSKKMGALDEVIKKKAEAGEDYSDILTQRNALRRLVLLGYGVEMHAYEKYQRIGGEAEARAVQAMHKNETYAKNFQGPPEEFVKGGAPDYKASQYPLDFYDVPVDELTKSSNSNY